MWCLRQWIGALALLAVSVALTGTAEARRGRKDRQMAKLVQQAQQQFEGEDFSGAAETLIKAYDLKPVPKLLYNIARAYDKGDDTEQALRFYQRYIDASDTDAELVRNAATRLAQLREDEVRREAEDQRRVEEEKRQADAERQRLEAETQRLKDEEKQRQADAERQRQEAEAQAAQNGLLAIAGYSLLGLGAVGLGTGGYFGVAALLDRDAWSDSLELEARQDLRDSARNNALGADIAMGSGALLAAAGGGLVLVSLLSSADGEQAEAEAGSPDAADSSAVGEDKAAAEGSDSPPAAETDETGSADDPGAAPAVEGGAA